MKDKLVIYCRLFLSLIVFAILIFACSKSSKKVNKNRSNGLVEFSEESTLQKNNLNALFPCTVNVYVENSASMDGYVKGVTAFEQAVYNYLVDMKIKDVADSLNLFYINSRLILQGSDIADFIEKLEPTIFRQRGGNRRTTDISNLLKLVFESSDDNNVSVLISDFIFSPGKNDAEQYLINQQIGIKGNVADFLKIHPNHGVVIYHLESQFEGYFYDKFDKPYKYKGSRPYYIWVIGHKQHLKSITTQCPASDFKGGVVKNIFSIVKGNIPVNYAIKYRSGNFKLNRNDTKHSIVEARKDTKGDDKKIRFSINVDYSDLLCDSEYLLDNDNYNLNDKDYDIDIVENKSDAGYTHLLKLSSDIVKPSTLIIKLKSEIPDWIEDVSDGDGVGIHDDNYDKTFGFEYLITGLYEGFTIDGDEYTTIKININK